MPAETKAWLAEQQRSLELEAVEMGIARYRKALEMNQSMRTPEQRLAVEVIEAATPALRAVQQEALEKMARRGRPTGYGPALLALPPEKILLLVMQTIFQRLSQGQSNCKATVMFYAISKAVQREITFDAIRIGNKDVYKRHIEFNKKWTVETIERVAKKAGVERCKWSRQDMIGLGSLLVLLVTQRTDLIQVKNLREGKHQVPYILLGDRVATQVREWAEKMEILSPVLLPMVVPPKSWDRTLKGGGYLWDSRGGVIENPFGDHETTQDSLLVRGGINYLQGTPFRVNLRVLEVVSKIWSQGGALAGLVRTNLNTIPPKPSGHWESEVVKEWRKEARRAHNEYDSETSQRISIAFKLSLGSRLSKYASFWFVHRLDFRGRAYTNGTHLQPQGDDLCRGLIEYAEPKAPGPDGLRQLKIHLANCHGIDKVSFPERVEWADRFLSAYHHQGLTFDPYTDRRWMDADEPWGALAAQYGCLSPDDAGSRLPVGVDGTCNGIQHLSALGRDSVGATAVSMLPSTKPSSLYMAIVAEVNHLIDIDCGTIRYDKNDPHPCWAWRGKVAKETVKQPVMTTPYGVTLIGMREQIKANTAIKDLSGRPYQLAEYMQLKIDEAMGTVIRASKSIMAWLRDVADICAAAGKGVQWTTPLGFRVNQQYGRTTRKQVRTSMHRVWLRLPSKDRRIHAQSQHRGLPPNFIHSLDANHMLATALRCEEEGITFSATHDSFKTHARDVTRLGELLREEFVTMYDSDLLADFKSQVERQTGLTLPECPPRGDLDIRQVMQADYFFS